MIVRHAEAGDAGAIGSIRVDTWHATYQGLVPEHMLNAMTYDQEATRWSRRFAQKQHHETTYVLAGADGETIGFAECGPEHTEHPGLWGEIYALYVRPGAQRRGGGRALLGVCARTLAGYGYRSLLVWALTENPYRRFYEVCGGSPVRRRTFSVRGVDLDETGYEWHDLQALADAGMVSSP